MYGGDISSTYREYARQLERHVFSDVVQVLREIDKELAPGTLSQFKLGQIQDFATIANLAQEQGVAMEDVNGGAPYLRDKAKHEFQDFARKVIAGVGV